jgi:hypothetical protein
MDCRRRPEKKRVICAKCYAVRLHGENGDQLVRVEYLKSSMSGVLPRDWVLQFSGGEGDGEMDGFPRRSCPGSSTALLESAVYRSTMAEDDLSLQWQPTRIHERIHLCVRSAYLQETSTGQRKIIPGYLHMTPSAHCTTPPNRCLISARSLQLCMRSFPRQVIISAGQFLPSWLSSYLVTVVSVCLPRLKCSNAPFISSITAPSGDQSKDLYLLFNYCTSLRAKI